MKTDFQGFGLRPTLLQALEDLDHSEPTPVQEAVIPVMLEGRDVIAQARTGTGKTGAFALPILQTLDRSSKQTQVLVLSPTRELAKQVGQSIEDYSRYEPVTVLTIYGGASYGFQKGILRKGAPIVVGTPGRLLDLIRQGNLSLESVKLLVLDEADEMLSMGFTEELEELISHLPTDRQTALFSATIPAEIKKLADNATIKPERINLSKDVSTRNVDLVYYTVREHDKVAAVTRLFEALDVSTALVFCRTRAQTSVLAARLTSHGIPAEALSGAMEQDAREMVLKRFRSEVFTVLVATDVAARGLDIDHLSHVINMDLPQSPDVFVHRIGRVGRAGRKGVAVTLITPKEDWKLKRIERALKRTIEEQKIPSKKEISRRRIENLYAKLAKWLESNRCRKELTYVEELQAAGYDAKQIAAAALKLAAASLKEAPIAEMNEDEPTVKPQRKTREKNVRFRREDSVQMVASIGKQQGLKVREFVNQLSRIGKIPAQAVGDIRITKTRTFVDIPTKFVDRILEANGRYKIGRHSFLVNHDS